MSKRYQPIDHRSFANYLFDTEDLDPIYVGLYRLNLSQGQLASWLLSYWCFYHAGVSCSLVESNNYWDDMIDFAGRKAAPRGTERRHFRGQKAVDAVAYLMHRYGKPLNAVNDLVSGDFTFANISERVQQWPLFGPWIAFKVADMLERCAQYPIDFSNCELSMYSEPTKGALLIAQQEMDVLFMPETLSLVVDVCQELLQIHEGRRAPPTYDRPINIQEIETILCKFKSHWYGHYPLGKDTVEVYHALQGYGTLADKMSKALYDMMSTKEVTTYG